MSSRATRSRSSKKQEAAEVVKTAKPAKKKGKGKRGKKAKADPEAEPVAEVVSDDDVQVVEDGEGKDEKTSTKDSAESTPSAAGSTGAAAAAVADAGVSEYERLRLEKIRENKVCVSFFPLLPPFSFRPSTKLLFFGLTAAG